MNVSLDGVLKGGWLLAGACAVGGEWAKFWPVELLGSLGLLAWGLAVAMDFRGSIDVMAAHVPATTTIGAWRLNGPRVLGVIFVVMGVLGAIQAAAHL